MKTPPSGPAEPDHSGRGAGAAGPAGKALGVAGELAPGAELAVVLEAAFGSDPRSWDAGSAIAVIQGIWRQTAHLQALQAQVLAAMTTMDEYTSCAAPEPGDLGDLDPGDPGDPGHGGRDEGVSSAGVVARARAHRHRAAEVVASELCTAVRISRKYARGLVAEAEALVTDTPSTWAALAAGRIDGAKARRICDRAGELLGVDEAVVDLQAAERAEQAASPDADGNPGEAVDVDEAIRAAREAAWNEAWARHDEVEAAALERAPQQTLGELSSRLGRLIQKADPEAARRRSVRRRQGRRLNPPRPSGDGEAMMTAVGPLEDLTALYAAVDAAARYARNHGDPRTLDQLRFDIAAGTGWAGLRLGHLGCCEPGCQAESADAAPAAHQHGAHERAGRGTTGCESTCSGTTGCENTAGESPHDESSGQGPVADDGESREWTAGDGVDSDAACPDPGRHDPGRHDPGHHDPGHHDPGHHDPGHHDPGHHDPGHHERGRQDPSAHEPGSHEPSGHEPSGHERGRQDPSAHEPGSHDAGGDGSADHRPGGRGCGDGGGPGPVIVPATLTPRLAGQARRPVQVNVTVPLSVLLGLSEDPAELDTPAGPEPLAAVVARALAFSGDATWRRLVTDPLSGTLLDVGRSTYTPPAALADFVRQRDRTSRFPTATTPAAGCELDHTIPFGGAGGGVTADHNLGAVDPTAHTHVTLHRWDIEQPEPGMFVWTSPAGLVHTVPPEPVHEPDPHADPLMFITDTDGGADLPPF